MTFLRVLILLLTLLMAGCNSSKQVSYPREKTLYIGGFQWGEPASFNPLSDWPVTWPATGGSNLMYESLFAYNILTGELEPLLASRYEFDRSVITVFLNEGTKWSDGKDLTVDDVEYTYYLHKRYQTLHHSIWRFIDTLEIDRDQKSISFVMDKKEFNPLTVKDMITAVFILPKHVFSKIETDAKEMHAELKSKNNGVYESAVLKQMLAVNFMDSTIGSGPYQLAEQSSNRIVLKRVDTYWGNSIIRNGDMAKPQYVIHPLYNGNDDYNTALEEGKLDVSATYSPMIWNQKKNGVGTWEAAEPYYIPGSIPSLLINHTNQKSDSIEMSGKKYETTKDVLKDASFRRAIAASIDYEMIRKKAIQGYAPELRPGFVISSGIENIFYNSESANKHGAFTEDNYDDLKTRQNLVKMSLADAGYTWIEDPKNPGGRLVTPDGKAIADLKMSTPAGWSDWEVAVKIAATSMRNIGIPVWEDYISEDDYWTNLGMGYFDFIMKSPQSAQLPSLPWSRFEKVMSSEDIDSIGQFIYANEGRYVNRAADSLLKVIPTLLKDNEVEEGYRKLNEIFMKDMPVIPLMYRPSQYYQFSTKHWDNFPTLDNPYAPPSCLSVAAGVKALWHINPKK